MSKITVSLIQTALFWEDKESNLKMLEQKIKSSPQETQVVFLPEMMSTGFSMQPKKFAETMDGNTVLKLKMLAEQCKKIICGSLIIEEEGCYYNRLLWIMPNGVVHYYDKRHLFGFAGEDKCYTQGSKRLIVQVNGIKLCLMVCYDLRFPVWARQTPEPYDVLVYVANWPQRRNTAWKTLLQARAIENQCYVIGVNRVGNDGNEIYHSGDSSVFDPLGSIVWQQADEEAIHTFTIYKEEIDTIRQQFPFLKDADNFLIL